MRLMRVNYFKVTLILAFPAIIKVERHLQLTKNYHQN